ncbi:MAG: hypothetical protein EBS06_07050, partial [Proteobacteria bacterium]|nr:hypothetical protein [Pseudomonadota bacterium]
MPIISSNVNNISWNPLSNAYYVTTENIGFNINTQQIILSPNYYVFQQYPLLYPNLSYQVNMTVLFVGSVSNLILSVTNSDTWITSVGKEFTIANGLSNTYYVTISWVFIPPPRTNPLNPSVFNLYIGSHQVPNMNQQQNAIIKYYNLNIQPIDGNLNMDGSIKINKNLNVYNETFLYGNTFIKNNLDIYGNSIIRGNTLLSGNNTLNSNVLVSGNTILNTSTVLSILNISGGTIINGDLTLLSNLNVSNNTNLYGLLNSYSNTILNNVSINSLLNISGNTIIKGNITASNNLLCSNTIRTQNINSISDIYTGTPNNNQILNINGKIINIGSPSSIINILGTTSYIATTELAVQDKLINLNINSDNLPFDIGSNTGILIKGTNGDGYIQTNNDATRFIIKSPASPLINYILTLDSNNNLNVSGSTLLNNTTINSILNINGSTTINSPLFVNNNEIITGNISIGSNLFVSGLSNLSGSLRVNSSNLPSINLSSNLINWDSGNQYVSTAEQIIPGVFAQQINLSSTQGVYKTYSLPYSNVIEYTLSLNLLFVNNISSLIISVTNTDSWSNSIYKIFTVNDGLNTTNYNQISWTFTPPPRVSSSSSPQMTIYIGANFIPNIIQQPTISIKYYNLQITPITGNILTDGSIYVNNGLDIMGISNLRNQTNIYGSLLVNNNVIMSSNVSISGPTLINVGTIQSMLNVAGNTILNGAVTINSSINILGPETLIANLNVKNNSTFNSSLLISGVTKLNDRLNLVSLSQTAINNLSNPTNGDIVFNSTTNNINIYFAGSWNAIGSNVSLNINGDTTLNSSLYVSGQSILNNLNAYNISVNNITVLSSINISGLSLLNGQNILNGQNTLNGKNILNNDTYINSLTVSNNSILIGNFNVSGLSIMQNVINNSLYVSNQTNLQGLLSTNSILNNNITILNSLYVSGSSFINGQIILNGPNLLNSLNVSNNSILNGNLNVSGQTILQNVIVNTLYVSGQTILQGFVSVNNILNTNITITNSLNVIGNSIFNGSNLLNTLNVSNNTSLLGSLNVSG